MRRLSLGLLLIAMTTLMVELALVRVFDVIWNSNMAYMIITMVMFCFGLSGVYLSLQQGGSLKSPASTVVRLAVLFSLANLLILPVLNAIPFDFNDFHNAPVRNGLLFLLIYFFISLPFFLAGMIITILFSSYSDKIQKLYFWDLVGAAAGCLILIPLIPRIGPGGIVLFGGGFGLIAAALFTDNRKQVPLFLALGLVVLALPVTRSILYSGEVTQYFDFKQHIVKRGVKTDVEQGLLERTHWDPISKIDILNQQNAAGLEWKHVAYDGGSQSSFIYPFDGNFKALRAALPKATGGSFGTQSVYLSHALKEGTNAEVLVIGSAAGQEVKAALTFGAGGWTRWNWWATWCMPANTSTRTSTAASSTTRTSPPMWPRDGVSCAPATGSMTSSRSSVTTPPAASLPAAGPWRPPTCRPPTPTGSFSRT